MGSTHVNRTVTTDGTTIAWWSHGPAEAPAVLLSHSLGLDARMWEPQVEALAGDYRVVTHDMRGHGISDDPAGPYSMERLASDALEVADAAGLDRFALVGLSIGGQIAQRIAVDEPGRLWALVLADTAARIGTAESWDERIRSVTADGLAPIAPMVVGRWFSDAFETREPARYEYAREHLLSMSPAGYLGCCAALAGSDLRAAVAGIDVPTLVIGGTADMPTPVADARWLHEAIAGSELVLLDGAAHISNLDDEPGFTHALVDFLGRHRDRPRPDVG